MTAKILVLAGSIRSDSLNRKLAQTLTDALAQKGVDAENLSLTDYELPLFNADIDVPENAIALARRFITSDALVFVSPEYNASLTPLLKNTIDWVSVTRNEKGEGFGPYRGKICFLASCSPGATGGLRGLYHLRAVLMNVGAEILTLQLAIGNGATAFGDNGQLNEERLRDLMDKGLDDLVLAISRAKAVPQGSKLA